MRKWEDGKLLCQPGCGAVSLKESLELKRCYEMHQPWGGGLDGEG